MKKIYILAAIALVAGASCTKQVPADNNSPDVAIGFTPISQRTVTKGQVFGEQLTNYLGPDESNPAYENFLAYAAYTQNNTTIPSADFFPAAGVECLYNATTASEIKDYWAPAEPYYWPKAGYLTFHAFSPSKWTDSDGSTDIGYAGTVTNNWTPTSSATGGITVSGFTAGTNKAKQIDILYSNIEAYKQRSMYTPENGMPYDDKTGGDVGAHNGVNIMFNHAMSAVKFRVVTDKDYAPSTGNYKHEFTVKQIDVWHVNTDGEFHENRAFNNASNLDAYANVPDGVTKYVTKNQNNANTATPYWIPSETPEKNYEEVFKGSQVVKTIDTSAPTTAQVDAAGDFGLYGDFIFPMPQFLSHGLGDGSSAGNNQVMVKVTYDYKFTLNGSETTYSGLTTTVSLAGNYAKKYDGNDTTSGGTTDGYQVNNWLINHKYFYTLVFKLDPIIFDPKVDVWVNVEDINVDLPYQN